MADDILQEVPEDEIPKVLEVMEKDWPNHFLLHQFITLMNENKKAKSNVQKYLYRYGNIEDGVYVFETTFTIGEDHLMKHFFLYTASTDLTDLPRVMKETSRIPWPSTDYLVEVTMTNFTPAVEAAALTHGVTDAVTEANYLVWLPPEERLELKELPEDIFLGYLNESHVPELDKNWDFRYPGSEKFLADQIRSNFGLGLFRKGDGKMLSYCLHFHSGGIYVLRTDPEARGKGYAEIIIQNMAKKIRDRGRIPWATILVENTPSQNLFKKIGFKVFSKVNYIFRW